MTSEDLPNMSTVTAAQNITFYLKLLHPLANFILAIPQSYRKNIFSFVFNTATHIHVSKGRRTDAVHSPNLACFSAALSVFCDIHNHRLLIKLH